MEGSISKRGRRALATVGVLALGLVAAVPSAMAGEASVVNGQAQFDAGFGEANDVTVERLAPIAPGGPTPIRIRDAAVDVTAGAGCTDAGFHVVNCNINQPLVVNAWLGNGDDRFEALPGAASIRVSVHGQPGDDTITGGAANDVLDGQDGQDVLRGGDGADDLFGGGNDDTLFGQGGADELDGELGRDSLNGGSGQDVMTGGDGADTLNADDNAGGDSLNCGTGPFATDLAIFNTGDTVSSNCDLLQPA